MEGYRCEEQLGISEWQQREHLYWWSLQAAGPPAAARRRLLVVPGSQPAPEAAPAVPALERK